MYAYTQGKNGLTQREVESLHYLAHRKLSDTIKYVYNIFTYYIAIQVDKVTVSLSGVSGYNFSNSTILAVEEGGWQNCPICSASFGLQVIQPGARLNASPYSRENCCSPIGSTWIYAT